MAYLCRSSKAEASGAFLVYLREVVIDSESEAL